MASLPSPVLLFPAVLTNYSAMFCTSGSQAAQRAKEGFDMVRTGSVPSHPWGALVLPLAKPDLWWRRSTSAPTAPRWPRVSRGTSRSRRGRGRVNKASATKWRSCSESPALVHGDVYSSTVSLARKSRLRDSFNSCTDDFAASLKVCVSAVHRGALNCVSLSSERTG